MTPDNPIFTYKIVIAGEGAVGKTSLRKRYMGDGFNTSHLPTLGADFQVKKVNLTNGNIVKFNIWDLAGQPGYKKIIKYYLKGSDAAILVFDITRSETLEKLEYWLNELFKAVLWPLKRIPLIIAGNKADLDHKINYSSITSYIQNFESIYKINLHYIETSAKTGSNVPTVFEYLAETLLKSQSTIK